MIPRNGPFRALFAGFLLVTALLLVPKPAAAYDDITFADGAVITTSITGHNIAIPVSAHVTVAGDVTITATGSVTVAGSLAGLRAADNHSYNFTLTAADSITISGSVITAGGLDGAADTQNGTAVGEAGRNGGAVTIRWGTSNPLGVLSVIDGAFIQSGDGGKGGNATVTSSAGGPRNLSATGGAGGNGGAIVLQGPSMVLQGTLHIGNGGNGGAALTHVSNNTTSQLQGKANATGGKGGSAASVTLPTGYTVPGLYAVSSTTGGAGGLGGQALAEVESMMTAYALSTYDGCGSLQGTWPDHGDGQDGCPGSDATATGGKGGCDVNGASGCVVGGAGGSATATALNGSPGGNGADGQQGLLADHPMGGKGGKGGNGGLAKATGGDGGAGFAYGGKGGDAAGTSGAGANGASGGNSGHYDSVEGGGVAPPSCYSGLICWFSVAPHIACGHAGAGGAKGTGPSASVTGGAQGWSQTGTGGGAGGVSGTAGANGLDGSAGGYPYAYCDHTLSHTHMT